LDHKNWKIRHLAAKSLGSLKDIRAVEPLIEVFTTEKRVGYEVEAARALKEIGEPSVEPLVHALKSRFVGRRNLAAIALGWIGDARATEALVMALRDADVDVRWQAARSLDYLGWKPRNDAELLNYLRAQRRDEKT